MYTVAIDIVLSIIVVVFLLNFRKMLLNIRSSVWRISEEVDQIRIDSIKDGWVSLRLTKRMKRAVKRGENVTLSVKRDTTGNYFLIED